MVGEGYDVKCAGFLVAKELDNFGKVLDNPTRPVLAILGGAKVIISISIRIFLSCNLWAQSVSSTDWTFTETLRYRTRSSLLRI
jgi:3-phosphoglycerate kinase